jgi:hypothetical protein
LPDFLSICYSQRSVTNVYGTDGLRVVTVHDSHCAACNRVSSYTAQDALGDGLFVLDGLWIDIRLLLRYDLSVAHTGMTFDAFWQVQQEVYARVNPVCFMDITADGKALGRLEITLRADVVPKTAGTSLPIVWEMCHPWVCLHRAVLCSLYGRERCWLQGYSITAGVPEGWLSIGRCVDYHWCAFLIYNAVTVLFACVWHQAFVRGGSRLRTSISSTLALVRVLSCCHAFNSLFGMPVFLMHSSGVLSMMSTGPNSHGSEFFLSLDRRDALDGKQVVFGNVSLCNAMALTLHEFLLCYGSQVTGGMEVLQRIQSYGSEGGNPKAKLVIADCGQLPHRFMSKSDWVDCWWEWNRCRKLDYDALFDCPICSKLPSAERAWILDVTRLGIKKERFTTEECRGCTDSKRPTFQGA